MIAQTKSKRIDYSKELIKGVSLRMKLEKEVENCHLENVLLVRKKRLCEKEFKRDDIEINLSPSMLNLQGKIKSENDEIYLNKLEKTLKHNQKNIIFKELYSKKRLKNKLNYLIFDSFEIEEDYTERTESRECSNNLGWFMNLWNQIIFLITLYTVFITPIYLSFYSNCLFLRVIEILLELVYIVDVLLNFITTYKDHEEKLLTQINQKSINYLKTWFIYDLLYICPLDLISTFSSVDRILICSIEYCLTFNFLKWIKILRIAKIFKKQTTGRYLHKIIFNESYNTLNRTIIFICIFFILSHITSCFFIFIGYQSINDQNWIVTTQVNELDKLDVYIASLYYILVTIYTVGYGDITPQNILEIVFIIFLLIFGSMIFSYGISILSTMFSQRNDKIMEFKRKKAILMSINDEYHLQPSLFKSIKLLIKHDFNLNEHERYELLSSLPPNIKNELSMIMFRTIIHKHKFFENQPQDFILYVLPLLKFQIIYKGDILMSVGEIIEEMYLILKGIISLHLGPEFDFMEIWQLKENEIYGDLLIQLNEKSPFEVKCNHKCAEILILKKSNFLKIKNAFNNNVFGILESSYDDFKKIEERRQLKIDLFLYYGKASVIRKKMRLLNMYLFNKGFNNYYYNDQQMDEVYQFLLKYDFDIIQKIMMELENPVLINKNSMNKNIGNSHMIEHTNSIIKNDDNSICEINDNKRGEEIKKQNKIKIIYNPDLPKRNMISTNNYNNYKPKYVDADITIKNPKIDEMTIKNLDQNGSKIKKIRLRSSNSIINYNCNSDNGNIHNLNPVVNRLDENLTINRNEFKKSSKKMRTKNSFSIYYNKIIKNLNSQGSDEILNREIMLNAKSSDLLNKKKLFKSDKLMRIYKQRRISHRIEPFNINLIRKSLNKLSSKSLSRCNRIIEASSNDLLKVEKTVDIHLTPNNKIMKNEGTFINLKEVLVENFSINDSNIIHKKKLEKNELFNDKKIEKSLNYIFKNQNLIKSRKKYIGKTQSFYNDNQKNQRKKMSLTKTNDNINIAANDLSNIDHHNFNNDVDINRKLDKIFNYLTIYKVLYKDT